MQEISASSAKLKLLNAALALFRERGYTDTSVDDLCRAAGVTKGTFFHYFSSKEALALAAIQHWNDMTGALFAGASYQAVKGGGKGNHRGGAKGDHSRPASL